MNGYKQAPTESSDALQFTPLVSILPVQSSMLIILQFLYPDF